MMAFKTNRESADAAKIAADEATLPNVRDRELRSFHAYAALAARDERSAAKAKDREAQVSADRADAGEIAEAEADVSVKPHREH